MKIALSVLLAVFAVDASGQAFEIDLPGNAIAYSTQTTMLYVTISGSAGPAYGGKLIEISPTNAQITNSVLVGGEPGALAISPDSPVAYIGLNNTVAVQPVNLASLTAGTQFQTPNYVQQISVMPGVPASVAVSLGTGGEGTVAIFDSGVLRGTTNGSLPSANSIAFDALSKSLLGFDNYDTNFTLSKYDVGSSGITLANSVYGMIQGFGATIVVDNGVIYSGTGATVNVAQLQLIGTYESSGPLVVDDSIHSVIFAHGNVLNVFDRDTFVPTFSLAIPGARGTPIGAAGCGSACVSVIFDSGQIFVVPRVSDRVFANGFE